MNGQPYSLVDMRAGDPLTPISYHGTVYQAYLNSTNCHRWHSPVESTIKKVYRRVGAYYAQSHAVGLDMSIQTAPKRT